MTAFNTVKLAKWLMQIFWMPFLCGEETWSFTNSTKSAGTVLFSIERTEVNSLDHTGAQIAPVLSKQTRVGWINSLPRLFPVLLSKT